MSNGWKISAMSIVVLGLALMFAARSAASETGKIHPGVKVGDKVWIFLTDKGPAEGVEESLSSLATSYDRRAIERRQKRRTRPGLFDEQDLAVHRPYIEAIEATGMQVVTTSKWLNSVSAMGSMDQIQEVAELPFVHTIQAVRRMSVVPIEENPEVLRQPMAGGFYGRSEDQLNEINLIALHNAGATGEGVIIGILDTGFRITHDAFNHPGHEVDVIAAWDFINDDANVDYESGDPDSQHSHGTYILGTMGAYLPNELVGAAYDAQFILAKTEDTSDEYQQEEDFYVSGLEFIEANGGDVATSSLSYSDWYTQEDFDGLTAVTTIGVNTATANGVVCCTAASNSGHDDDPETSHLGAPADAFRVITVGAVTSAGEIASFSADGPTADGRIKPELLARGVDTDTVTSMSDSGFTEVNGTSLSTPLLAGAVACLLQAQPTWTVDQLRAMTFATADNIVAPGTYDPLYVYGWGELDAYQAVVSDCNANGVVDTDDVDDGTSNDCDGSGVPDECEDLPSCVLSDLDCSGVVDFADILEVLANWGACDCPEDIDDNGEVDFADILAILSAWGPCS